MLYIIMYWLNLKPWFVGKIFSVNLYRSNNDFVRLKFNYDVKEKEKSSKMKDLMPIN